MNGLSETKSRSVKLDVYMEYVKAKRELLKLTRSLFDRAVFRRFRMKTMMKLRQSEDKFLKNFRQKYGPPKHVIIIYGDWKETQGFIRGKEPSKGRSMIDLFQTRGGYAVYLLDEYRTSKKMQ